MTKITINDVWKKHFKIIAYLVVSAILGYISTLIVNDPRAIYITPVINYILYALEQEREKQGFIKAIENEK